jgi:hypothetical protein
MTDDEIINTLERINKNTNPDDVIKILIDMDRQLTQFQIIGYLKFAFPEIPLSVLKEASTCQLLVGSDGMSDKALSELLRPWARTR